jgi:hypothetical protein
MNTSSVPPGRRLSNRTIRLLLGIGIPCLAALLAVGPIVLWGRQLPDRLATHWGASGPADGFMSRGVAYAVIASLLAAGIVVLVVAATRRRPTIDVAMGFAVSGGLACGIAGGSSIALVSANRNVSPAAGPPTLSIATLVASLAALIIFVLTTGVLASSLAVDQPLPLAAVPLPTHAGERVIWTGTSRPNPLLFVVMGLLVVVNVIIGLVRGQWGFASTFGIVVGVALLIMTGNRVTVGPTGLRASMGLFGVPRVNIPLEKIVQASALDVRPLKWGGWGYRGNVTVAKRAAMVVRAGDGIRLDLVGGLVLVVTVDDAATGASVLQAAVANRDD